MSVEVVDDFFLGSSFLLVDFVVFLEIIFRKIAVFTLALLVVDILARDLTVLEVRRCTVVLFN